MPERDLFDRLADVPGEPPRPDFVDQLERRLLTARSDVGPATPTDQLIEGVVLMPDPQSPSHRRRAVLAVAGAATIAVLALVLLSRGDDESSRPIDVVTEPDEPEVAEDLEGRTTLPSVDATSLEVGEVWIQAVHEFDLEVFRALHADDAMVDGSVFTNEGPTGRLSSAVTAARYWGGWDAHVAAAGVWGSSNEPGSCVEDGDHAVCTTANGLFGPGTTPIVEATYSLRAEAGRVVEVSTAIAFTSADGGSFFDGWEWDQQVFDQQIAPQYAECIAIGWNSGPCGAQVGEQWIEILESMAPDLLDLPDRD